MPSTLNVPLRQSSDRQWPCHSIPSNDRWCWDASFAHVAGRSRDTIPLLFGLRISPIRQDKSPIGRGRYCTDHWDYPHCTFWEIGGRHTRELTLTPLFFAIDLWMSVRALRNLGVHAACHGLFSPIPHGPHKIDWRLRLTLSRETCGLGLSQTRHCWASSCQRQEKHAVGSWSRSKA